MNSCFTRLIAISTLGLVAMSANATTYNVHEIFKGTFTETSLGDDNFSSAYNYNLDSVLVGDSSLFAVSQSVIYDYGLPRNLIRTLDVRTGEFTQTLKNGDMLFGNMGDFDNWIIGVTYHDLIPRPDLTGISYHDFLTIFITGGTGLFAGASGIGELARVDTYLTASSGTSEIDMIFNITTPDIVPPNPVPLPAAAWLFGSVLLGFAGLRRKSNI